VEENFCKTLYVVGTGVKCIPLKIYMSKNKILFIKSIKADIIIAGKNKNKIDIVLKEAKKK